MADRGYRSIEVTITNQTSADLTIQVVSLGSGNTWISGEEAKQGGSLLQYDAVTWGVMTKDPDTIAQGRINLFGLGTPAISIEFSNDASGAAKCSVSTNSVVRPGDKQPKQVSGDEDNHVQYACDLFEIGPTDAKSS
jgi:hypothetical protein